MLVELSMVEQRNEAVMAVLRDGEPVTEVAARLEVNRSSVHRWIVRYQAGGLGALADRSHRPESCPHQMPAEVEALVCDLRRQHPFWGPTRLAHEIARRGVDPPPSRSAVYRALLRHRLIEANRAAWSNRLGALGTTPAYGAVADGRRRRDHAQRRDRAEGSDRAR